MLRLRSKSTCRAGGTTAFWRSSLARDGFAPGLTSSAARNLKGFLLQFDLDAAFPQLARLQIHFEDTESDGLPLRLIRMHGWTFSGIGAARSRIIRGCMSLVLNRLVVHPRDDLPVSLRFATLPITSLRNARRKTAAAAAFFTFVGGGSEKGMHSLVSPAISWAHQESKETSESEAIRLAQAGDAAAFERLYKLHSRRVYALCLRMIGSTAEAEDLTQEAFLQLFRKIKTFRGESAFSTWLHRLAVNIVLMRLRKRTIKQTSLEQPDEHEQGDLTPKEIGARDLVLAGVIDR